MNNDDKKLVLVIEDDDFLREIITHKLSGEGFSVEAVINAEETFDVLKAKKPDIILLDLVLPNVSGFEILSQVKQMPDREDIPVIVLSNLGEPEDIDKATKLGAIDYLIKSNFTTADIVQKIKEILKKK